MFVNDELESMWKEAVVVYFKVLSLAVATSRICRILLNVTNLTILVGPYKSRISSIIPNIKFIWSKNT
jgi:hypothetical protein